jgi:hypothetical protein
MLGKSRSRCASGRQNSGVEARRSTLQRKDRITKIFAPCSCVDWPRSGVRHREREMAGGLSNLIAVFAFIARLGGDIVRKLSILRSSM